MKRNFSIRRHAVQQLLRQALDASPQPVHGLLGGHGDIVESVFALHGNVGSLSISEAMQLWQEKDLHLIGSYSSQESVETFELPTELLMDEWVTDLHHLPRLIIRTDTRGRIEASLLAPDSGGGIYTCALQMQEDGGLYPLGDRG